MPALRRFQTIAFGFTLGGLIHASEAVASLLGHGVRDYPLWRHGLFVVLDGGLAAFAILSPRLLWLPLLLLLTQQTTTHGRDLVVTLRTAHTISWLSLITMLFVATSAILACTFRWNAPFSDRMQTSDAPAV